MSEHFMLMTHPFCTSGGHQHHGPDEAALLPWWLGEQFVSAVDGPTAILSDMAADSWKLE
jgi:hypothetical protein